MKHGPASCGFPQVLGPVSASSQRQTLPWACDCRRLSPDRSALPMPRDEAVLVAMCTEPTSLDSCHTDPRPHPECQGREVDEASHAAQGGHRLGAFLSRERASHSKSEGERALGPRCEGQEGAHVRQALLKPSNLKDPYQFYLKCPASPRRTLVCREHVRLGCTPFTPVLLAVCSRVTFCIL